MRKADAQLTLGMKALANDTRLRILATLYKKPMTNQGLLKIFKVNQAAVSRHLTILRRAKLTVQKKEGTRIWVSVNQLNVENLFLKLRRALK